MSRIWKLGDVVKTDDLGAQASAISARVIGINREVSPIRLLLEFSVFVSGFHSGGQDGAPHGKRGHCYWVHAPNVTFIRHAEEELKIGLCSKCGKSAVADTIKDFKEHHLCDDCFIRHVKKCNECNELFLRTEGVEIHGDWYCEECFSDKDGCHCHECSMPLWDDETCVSEAGDTYCEECYGQHFAHCSGCGEVIDIEDSCQAEGNHWCDNCFAERFDTCHRCEDTVRRDNLIYDEENDRYICASCQDNGEENHIHDYGYRPENDFKKVKGENTLFLGVELEVQNFKEGTKAVSNKLLEFLKEEKIVDNFYLKHDGSVSSGFEIVTHPFTWKYAHKEIKWYKLFNWLKKHKFSSQESGECGLHVHVSREFFSDLDITKLRIFFSKNKEQIYKFSKREGHGDRYCEYEEFDQDKFIHNETPNGRYWALNLNSSRDTIEFRAFRGTLDYDRFLASLQFVHAVSHFVQVNGITSFLYGEGRYKDNSWKLFIDWCKEDNYYTHLISYFEKGKLCA